MKTKVCGLNPTRDVQLCIDLQIDYLGFVFYEKSPRNVNISDIKELSKYDKKKSAFVAVTVNPSDEFIRKNILGNFDFIQLHGSESKDRVAKIKDMGLKIIKTIKVKEKIVADGIIDKPGGALDPTLAQKKGEGLKRLINELLNG